jgi:cell division transport system ATP-binding protein
MIIFSSVSKQFIPDIFALQDISFEINPGEFVVITGPAGSGKTTLMKLLTKEYNPTSGEIIFHEINLNEIPDSKLHEHRRKIGVVFQDYKLISELNVWENIALPLSIIGKEETEIEERVTDLLELVSLTEKAFMFPKQLSGGEAQKVSIARALSTAPAIIFADEPTGNLDKDNSLLIAKLLTKINELGTTILFATHDHDVIDNLYNHRHITLDDGNMVKDTGKKPKPEEKEEKVMENKESEKEKTPKDEKKDEADKTTKKSKKKKESKKS